MSSKKDSSETEEAPKKTSIVVHIAMFLVVTALAGGAGFGASMFLKDNMGDGQEKAVSHNQTEDKSHSDMEKSKGADSEKSESQHDEKEGDEGSKLTGYAKPLAPILTNLAAPKSVWVRLELAVVTKQDATEELLEQIHQDLLAYMRTVKLHHVNGPSGYINLKAELSERASIRSGGTVSRVLVRTILFE